ncbi:spermine synthase [Lysobacter sp.]|uniref:spermine/spermidine synthase domain-containing protein n=1 Tax=Lysobacter sp. TaxID=72226 RepID=UPI002D684589|nr:spermine synthase [Lysobacter sp.]HZX77222.1 spermine synthase [Lysobacter sp.]
MFRQSKLSFVLLLLFVLSGVAGLIYQSIWSHYLGLVLGHAAYAQALVLAIFMGGMAAGAWLASRWSQRLRHLILAYAVIELAIGVMGLVFHGVFVAYTDFSQHTVLPALSSASTAHLYQWVSASLLILPQCILLGATFPLLSAGLLRVQEEGVGEVLGGLYFSNSIGAAAGALLTTFVVLPMVGMPGTILTAGILNILVALIAWGVSKALSARPERVVENPVPAAADNDEIRRLSKILLASAFVTGATSFIYEIGWVRLLNQALGTTVHSFELMLAAFIFGLAFGGLWIRRRAKRITDAIAYAGGAQILMGVSALLSLVAFSQSFHWVGWMMQALARTDGGYVLFNLGGALVALLVMFPAAFFAGMTLPLFTLALLNKGAGERAIGRVYAANTLGAIAGVVLMMHLLIPVIGVRLGVILAALADAVLGLYLIRAVSPARRTVGYAIGGAATVAALLVAMYIGRPDARQQVAGVFRTGVVTATQMRVPYLRDGKTATVSVSAHPIGHTLISTNGKPDASLSMDPRKRPTFDEITMVMAGVLPYIHHSQPRRIAVIGWGSGLTTHTLAGSARAESIETIEIEQAMYDGARLFGDRVARAYEDKRSQVRFEDARTYFSTGNRRYDVVVSEPSNPWVSGVASLFTREFYGFIKQHLNDDGVLVQWLQTYELNDELLGTMVAALLSEFPNTELYVTNTNDIVFVASKGNRARPDWSVLGEEPLASELRRVGLESPGDFAVRRIGGPRVLETYVRYTGSKPYSDFYPTVALNAPRSRFREELADSLMMLVDNGLPVLDLLDGRKPYLPVHETDREASRFSDAARGAGAIRDALVNGDASVVARAAPSYANVAGALREASSRVITQDQVEYWSGLAASVAGGTLGLLPAEEQEGLWTRPAWIDASQQPELVQQLMQVYAAAAARDPAAMHQSAIALLRRDDVAALAPAAREQVLVIAQLGAIGTGANGEVQAIDRAYGQGIAPSARLGLVRGYLMAWADQPGRNASAAGSR